MTAFLVGTAPQTVIYDRTSGRYRGSDGKFVSRATVLRLVDQESNRLATRMKAHARLLTSGKIDLPEWQRRSAEDLKLSHLRSGILGSGGKALATNQTYGTVGRGLRSQYEYLDGFSRDIANGKLTKSQIVQRASLYGASTRSAFHQSEKIARGREGFKLAMRQLDSAAIHCLDCLKHSTNGKYVPINEIVPIASRCRCFSRCRCSIIFKK